MAMLARILAVLALLFFGSPWAAAQDSGQPLFGSTVTGAEPQATGDQDGDFHILVIGDALGGGLGAGLTRMAKLEDGFDVTIRFNEESGIARPELYDWSESLPKILDGKAYDAVVVMLGANDRQMIRSGPMRFAFNTPEWTSAYKAQTDRVLDALGDAGPKIYWVSAPPMADPDYQAAMRIIVELQKERVEAKGAIFVDIRNAFLNSDGTYTDTGADETGAVRKLRARDGVSFFKQGNNLMGQLVLGAIKRRGTEKPDASQPATAKTGLTEAPIFAGPVKPLFGQRGANNVDVSFRPKDFDAAAVAVLVEQGAFGTGLAALQAIAKPGSAAEKLFVTGETVAAPPGRADDYSLPK
ncbi:MAG: DUF459 domain-containing protein [Rhizobiales bacterium]|nr:DUF459 domain-containing protein [Hyphomicrobiales bacterium]